MPPRELKYLLGDVRSHTARYMAGGPGAFDGFLDLVSLLLHTTVLTETAAVRIVAGESNVKYLCGWRGLGDPLAMTDGRYLRVIMALYLEDTPHGSRRKVDEANFQYQEDRDEKRWIFRYDYRRHPKDQYAGGHLQIRGKFIEGGALSQDTHFPTGRVSLVSKLRLLIEDFHVPPREPPDNWRPTLAQSEAEFLRIAHQPLSGPAS